MNILDEFLKYISYDTTSKSKSTFLPSSVGQIKFADYLVEQLQKIGVNVTYDEVNCYVYGLLEGNSNLPSIGFISHLDTSEDARGYNINPQIIKNYNGQNVKLKNGELLTTDSYPDLLNHKGKTLITTDGTTLLGADDKAGIVEIMAMLDYFAYSSEQHGNIYVCFTPDEEIGLGVKNFNADNFKTSYAYTVDGSSVGEICYENFNGASANITINGISTHCGSAKGKMVNSMLIANDIISLLSDEVPENTEGYEGFFHLDYINGKVEKTELKYLIRDFDKSNFEQRKKKIIDIVDNLNMIYGNFIELEIKDSYYNMKDIISKEENYHLIKNAQQAIKKCGIFPIVEPIRGGTDGTELSYRGIPCPNLGTGGHNFHSVHEYICLEDMDKSVEILINIVREYAKLGPKLTRKQ